MRGHPQPITPEPQFTLTLAAAAAVHLAVLSLSWDAQRSVSPPSSRALIELDLSLDLHQAPTIAENPTTAEAPATPAATHGVSAQSSAGLDITHPLAASDTVETRPGEATSTETTPPPPAGSAASTPKEPTTNKTVRLFLGGDQLSHILKQTTRDAAPSAPDLWQELHTKDAARGLSPASPAVAATYHAARKAPREGSAQLRVRVDAEGHVTSVQLIGSAPRDQWSAVVEDLLARLKTAQFRLPPQAGGLELQLRVDRGLLAEDAQERFKVEPGYALGQDPPPRGIVRDDSARASFEESGRISPTARMVDTSWYHDTAPTRVVVEVMKSL